MRVSSQAMTSTAGQGLQRAQGDVAEVADRRRHQMQSRRRLGGGQQLPGHR